MLQALFKPSSIVVVGGSNDVSKSGGRLVAYLRRGGFRNIQVVNAKGAALPDLPVYASIEALPGPPDLAFIAIPAPHVLDAVQRLLTLGARTFVVLSAGFSELDDAGRQLERQLVELVARHGATLIGPNSLGAVTPDYYGIFAGVEFRPERGSIDFITASGSTAVFIIEAGLMRGLRFATLVSVGNSAQIGVEEVLAFRAQHFAEAPVKAVLLYLEAIADPAALREQCRALHAQGCRTVALKPGVSEVGARAVSALFDQAGVIRVHSKTEMIDVAGLLTGFKPLRGKRICIVTHAGGPAIVLADELTRLGFEVPELAPETQQRLCHMLAPGSACRNPVDFLASGSVEQLHAILDIVGSDPRDRIDGICAFFGSHGLTSMWPACAEIIDANRRLPIPVYPVLPSARTAADELRQYREAGHFYFHDEACLARAMAAIARTPPPADPAPAPTPLDQAAIERALTAARSSGQLLLAPDQVETVLEAAGFELPPSAAVDSAAQAVAAAQRIGIPVALKVVGPSHKSDVAGVRLGIADDAACRSAFEQLMRIAGARGVLVQRQVGGLELILGVSREAGFGHLILFGLGGIFTEAIADVASALAPLGIEQAQRLVDAIRGQRLLDGVRGRPGVDRAAVARCLCQLSTLVQRFPQIKELDINPLIGSGRELWAVDGRIEIAD